MILAAALTAATPTLASDEAVPEHPTFNRDLADSAAVLSDLPSAKYVHTDVAADL